MTLHDELWLCNRLKDHGGKHVHDGDTSYEIRRERVRAIITGNGWGEPIVGSKAGKPVTYREAFARVYGEPLG